MGWMTALIVILILNLAGCSNSGNPDAPTSKAPHEKTWVVYHRGDILNAKSAVFSSATAALKPGLLIREHVIQCQACHGENLLGAKGGATGPACLDCHVLDPVRYPVMCFSCHGFPVVTTQQWYSSNRASRPGLPLGPEFSNRVANNDNVHLKHQTVPQSSDFKADECAVCHGGKDKRGVKHHEIVMDNLHLGCVGPLPFGCHVFNFDQPIGAPTFSIPNCSINTPQMVCHPSGN